MLIARFYAENYFSVKKIHKNCCKQSCSFWLRYQQNHSAAGDPTGGAYSVHPDLLAVFRGPTSKGRKGGEREKKEGG